MTIPDRSPMGFQDGRPATRHRFIGRGAYMGHNGERTGVAAGGSTATGPRAAPTVGPTRLCFGSTLQWVRQSILDKVAGLPEYDLRRPLTITGTNLLGLIKHLTVSEAVYLGDIFGRPFPEPHPRFDDPGYRNRDSLWVSRDESSAGIVDAYRRVWRHADATIAALPIDAAGFVPWWPRREVKLFNVMVHVLTESNRHAGHADILREQLDEINLATSAQADEWEKHRTRIEEAAHQASHGI